MAATGIPSHPGPTATDFDRWVVVDWSAARPPNRGPNSIWIADLPSGAVAPRLTNPPSQPAAMATLGRIVDEGGRVLIGLDFCFGAVRGFGRHLPPEADMPPWRRLWQYCAAHLADDLSDKWDLVDGLNGLTGAEPGPFWGGPRLPRRPENVAGGLARWRHCEAAARAAGWRPKSVWQVAYAGAVGLQSLTGMARLEPLVAAGRAVVWPMQTGLTAPGPEDRVVLAEVYPTMFPERGDHAVKDARQVHGTVLALRDAAASGALAGWLGPVVPRRVVDDVVDEEGWVLGVTGATATTGADPPGVRRPRRAAAGR